MRHVFLIRKISKKCIRRASIENNLSAMPKWWHTEQLGKKLTTSTTTPLKLSDMHKHPLVLTWLRNLCQKHNIVGLTLEGTYHSHNLNPLKKQIDKTNANCKAVYILYKYLYQDNNMSSKTILIPPWSVNIIAITCYIVFKEVKIPHGLLVLIFF